MRRAPSGAPLKRPSALRKGTDLLYDRYPFLVCFVQWLIPPCTFLYDPSLSTFSTFVLIVLRCSWLNVLHH